MRKNICYVKVILINPFESPEGREDEEKKWGCILVCDYP